MGNFQVCAGRAMHKHQPLTCTLCRCTSQRHCSLRWPGRVKVVHCNDQQSSTR